MEADSPEESSPCLIVVDSQDSVDANTRENRLQDLAALKESRSTEDEIVPPSQEEDPCQSGIRSKRSEDTEDSIGLLKAYISTPSESVGCLTLSQPSKILVQETSDDTVSPAPLSVEEVPIIIPSSPTEQTDSFEERKKVDDDEDRKNSFEERKKVDEDEDCKLPDWQKALNEEVSSSKEPSSTSNSLSTSESHDPPSSCSLSSLQLQQNWQETNQADSSQSAKADFALQTSFHTGNSEPINRHRQSLVSVAQVTDEVHSGGIPHSTSDGVISAGVNTSKPDQSGGDTSADVSSSSQDLRLHLTQSQPETEAEGVKGHLEAAFRKPLLDTGRAEDQFSQSELSDNNHFSSQQKMELPAVTSSDSQTGHCFGESAKSSEQVRRDDLRKLHSKSPDYEMMGNITRSKKDPSSSSSQPTLSQVKEVKNQSSQQEQPLTPSDEVRSISKESTLDSNSFHLTMKDGSGISPFDKQGGSPKTIRHSTPIIPEEEDSASEAQQEDGHAACTEFHLSVPSKEQVQAIRESPTKRNTSVFSLVHDASLGSAKKLENHNGQTQEEDDPFAGGDSVRAHNLTGGTSSDTIIVDLSEDTQTYGLVEPPTERRDGHSGKGDEDVASETSVERSMVVGVLQPEPNNNGRRRMDHGGEDGRYTEVRDPYDFTESQSNLMPSVPSKSNEEKKTSSRKNQKKGKQSRGRTRAGSGTSKNGRKEDEGGGQPDRGGRGEAMQRGAVDQEPTTAGRPKRQSSSTSTSSGSNKPTAHPTSPRDTGDQAELHKYYKVVSVVRETWVSGKLIRTTTVEINRDAIDSSDAPPMPPSPTHSISSGYMGDLSSMGSRSSSNAGSFQKSLSLGSKNSSSSGSFGKEISPVTTPSPPVIRKGSSTSSSKSSVHFSPELEHVSTTKAHSPLHEKTMFKEPGLSSLKKTGAKSHAGGEKGVKGDDHEKERRSQSTRRGSQSKDSLGKSSGVTLREGELSAVDRGPGPEDEASKEHSMDTSSEDSRLLELWDQEAQGIGDQREDKDVDADSVPASYQPGKGGHDEARKEEREMLSSGPGSKEPRKRGRDTAKEGMVVDPAPKGLPRKKRKTGVGGENVGPGGRGTRRKDRSEKHSARTSRNSGGEIDHVESLSSVAGGGNRTKRKEHSERISEDANGGDEDESESPVSESKRAKKKGGAKKLGEKEGRGNKGGTNPVSKPSEVRRSSRGRGQLGQGRNTRLPPGKEAEDEGSRNDGRDRGAAMSSPGPGSEGLREEGGDASKTTPLEGKGHRKGRKGRTGDRDKGHRNGRMDLVKEGDSVPGYSRVGGRSPQEVENTDNGGEKEEIRRSPRNHSTDRKKDDSDRMDAAKEFKGHQKKGKKKSGKSIEVDPSAEESAKTANEKLPDVQESMEHGGPPATATPDMPAQEEEQESRYDILATPPPGSPTVSQDSASFSEEILRPGMKVLSKWPQNSYYYPSIVQKHLNGNKYQVLFDDCTVKEVTRCNIVTKEWLSKGQPVFVTTQDEFIEAAIIIGYYRDRMRGFHGYVIQDERGTSRRVPKTQVLLTADQAQDLMSSYSSSCSDVTLDNIISGKRSKRATRMFGTPSPSTSRRSKHGSTSSPQTVKKTTKKRTNSKDTSSPTPSTGIVERLKEPEEKGQPDLLSESLLVTGDEGGMSAGLSGVSRGVNHTLMNLQTAAKESAASGSTPRSGVKRRISKDEPESRETSARKKLNLEADSPSLHTGSRSPLRRSLRRSQMSPVSSEAPLPKSKTLFRGYTFVITYAEKPADSEEGRDSVPFSKAFATQQIKSGGGVIQRDFDKAWIHSGKVFLISNTYCRTKKYFLALATGIPCLSHIWLNECCRTGHIQRYQDYLLPAGLSEEEGGLVEWHPGCYQILAGLKAMVVSEDQTVINSIRAILIAAGCELVNTLPSNLENSEDETVSFNCHVIITDPTCPRQILNKARELDVPIVSLEWLMQTLINGRRVSYYRSYKYAWDYMEKPDSQST